MYLLRPAVGDVRSIAIIVPVSQKTHVQTSQNFLCMLPQPPRYVLSVLDVMFSNNGQNTDAGLESDLIGPLHLELNVVTAKCRQYLFF